MKIFLAVLELFHVSSWRDGGKEAFYRLFAGKRRTWKNFLTKLMITFTNLRKLSALLKRSEQ
jgi:hypothetical protein